MRWVTTAKFDRKRLRLRLEEIASKRPEINALWARLSSTKAEELDRLAIADALEEEGQTVMAKCVREYTAVKRRKKRRKK